MTGLGILWGKSVLKWFLLWIFLTLCISDSLLFHYFYYLLFLLLSFLCSNHVSLRLLIRYMNCQKILKYRAPPSLKAGRKILRSLYRYGFSCREFLLLAKDYIYFRTLAAHWSSKINKIEKRWSVTFILVRQIQKVWDAYNVQDCPR